jgi:hypothetical protein
MTIKHQRANLIFRVLCAVLTAAVPGVKAASAQSLGPKTVADFFLLVPERYMESYDPRSRQELLRGERGDSVVDIRHGYISWDASDNPEEFRFAIFRRSNGRYIVAFSVGYNSQYQNPGSTLLLLSYEDGKWRDVTRATLPVPFDKKLAHKLPRQGRGIEVTSEAGRKLYTLTWANDRFRIKRAARR